MHNPKKLIIKLTYEEPGSGSKIYVFLPKKMRGISDFSRMITKCWQGMYGEARGKRIYLHGYVIVK